MFTKYDLFFIFLFITGLHYGGVSLHFVNSNFYLYVFVLACKLYDLPNQKAHQIRDFLNTILEEFNLKLTEDTFVVSDNEPKMICAFKDDAIRVGCSAHYINKVIEHAFESDEALCVGVQNLFTIVRDIINYIRQSHKQSFLSVCIQNYCKTRFSTVYIMLNSFLAVYNELPSILNNNQRQSFLKINYNELVQLTKYLKHFHDVLEKLCCEETPTLHLVVSYKQLLINRSTKNDDDHPNLIQLKRYLSEHLQSYWKIKDVHYVAMLLHPNLKSFYLIPSKKEYATGLLKVEFNKLVNSADVHQAQKPTLNDKKERKKTKKNMHSSDTLDEIFDVSIDENDLQTQLLDKSELDLYLEDETRIHNNMNPLSYWNSNKSLYPNLAQIAKRILSIPATNTSVERLFSHSGNTVTNRRTRLDADKVNNLLFIKRNLRTLKEIYPTPVEQSSKRKSRVISTDSISSTTPHKKLKLMTVSQDIDEIISDEYFDDEQL